VHDSTASDTLMSVRNTHFIKSDLSYLKCCLCSVFLNSFDELLKLTFIIAASTLRSSLDAKMKPQLQLGKRRALDASMRNVLLVIREVRLPVDDALWLSAVGLEVGERVCLLRAAPLGDPLHIRTEAGTEFALARALAACIDVEECAVND
jgi:Fe2+ transport system protein FeoA